MTAGRQSDNKDSAWKLEPREYKQHITAKGLGLMRGTEEKGAHVDGGHRKQNKQKEKSTDRSAASPGTGLHDQLSWVKAELPRMCLTTYHLPRQGKKSLFQFKRGGLKGVRNYGDPQTQAQLTRPTPSVFSRNFENGQQWSQPSVTSLGLGDTVDRDLTTLTPRNYRYPTVVELNSKR